MSVMFNDLTITSLETITAFAVSSGEYRWTLDELQNATIANTQETTDITGKQGRLLNTLKRNKGVTISGTNGLISGGLLETQTGSKFAATTDSDTVMYSQYITVADGLTATIAFEAIGTEGNEIDTVRVLDKNGVTVKTLKQADAAASGKFSYEAKVITFAEGDVVAGDQISVHYYKAVEGFKLQNLSDTYSEKVELFIDAFAEDKCANVYRVQYHVPAADFSGNFDIQMGDSQAVHAFEARSLAIGCGSDGNLWDVTVFVDEEAAA